MIQQEAVPRSDFLFLDDGHCETHSRVASPYNMEPADPFTASILFSRSGFAYPSGIHSLLPSLCHLANVSNRKI
jgi:hypothetical protein